MLSTSLTIPPAATLNAVAERKLVAAGVRSVVPVIFGYVFASGGVLNVLPAGAGSTTLLVQVLWGHGTLGGIDEERLNDLALPAGSTVTHFLGSQTGTHAPLVAAMAAQGITYTATLNGFAYSVFAIPIRSFTGQLNFTARVQGLRLYDPRLDSTNGGVGAHRLADPSTWATSDNPALADARWLTDTVFGCSQTVNWPSVITTANACDALIGAPAEKRRIIGLTIDRPSRVADVAEALRAYAGCWHVPGASGIRLVPDTTGTSQASYSHTAGTLLRIGPLVARDIGGAPTAVEVIYTDTSKRPVRDGVAIASIPGAGTTLPYRPSQVRLPGIARYSQALREATERLNKLNLGDIGTDIEFLDEGIRHEVGDLIDLSHPVGLSAKVFRLAAPPELVSRGRYRAPVVEYDPAMYSSTVATAPTVPDTLLINPAGPPPNVVGMFATTIPGAVRITWPPKPVADIDVMEIRRGVNWAAGVSLESGAAVSTDVDGTSYDWLWPPLGTYTLWFRWRDRDGNLSALASSFSSSVTEAAIGIGSANINPPPEWLNANITVAGGVISGIGTGAGTQVDNTFNGIGQNLLANSDQANEVGWSISGPYNGASIQPPVYNGGAWTTADYVLSAGRTRSVALFETGRVSAVGGANPSSDADSAGNLISSDVLFPGAVPVVPGQRLCISVYGLTHRCRYKVYAAVVSATGASLLFPFSTEASTAETLANSLGLYSRASALFTVPANAASMVLLVRKYTSFVGAPNSWLWLAAPQVEVVNANTAGPSPYMPGPSTDLRQMIPGGSLTAGNVGGYVSAGAMGTTQLADQAATGPFSEETFSVPSGQAISGFTVLDSMTVSVATACRLEMTLTGEGVNIYPDAGNSLSWSYRINGGAWVFLAGVPDGATARRSVTLRRTIDPAPVGTYEFELSANKGSGSPTPVIYFGQMMALQIKK
jgi:hypothetical protein